MTAPSSLPQSAPAGMPAVPGRSEPPDPILPQGEPVPASELGFPGEFGPPSVLESLYRRSCLAFLGLPGRMAEVFCAAGAAGSDEPEGTTGCLPAVLDRAPVDPLDVAVGAYRPAELGRPRARAAVRRRALTDPRTLPEDGLRPEDALVRERTERSVAEEQYCSLDHDRSSRRTTTTVTATGRRTRHAGRHQETAAEAPDLVRRFDLVLQTIGGPTEPEWDLPLDPATPVLQCVRRDDGRIVAVALEPWAARRCRDCLLDRAAVSPVLDVALLAEAVTRPAAGPTGPVNFLEAGVATRPKARDFRACCCRLGGDVGDRPGLAIEDAGRGSGDDPKSG